MKRHCVSPLRSPSARILLVLCGSVAGAALLLSAGCDVRSRQSGVTPRPLAVETPVAAPEAVPTPAPRYVAGGEGSFDLKSLLGRVVLIDVGATWSPPCRAAVPEMNRVQEELSPGGLSVVGMMVDRAPFGDVSASAQGLGAIYPLVMADPAYVQQFGAVRALPTRILLDRKGAVRKVYAGAVPVEQIRAEAAALLNGG